MHDGGFLRRFLILLTLLVPSCDSDNPAGPGDPKPAKPPQFVAKWGHDGTAAGEFRYPDGVAAAPNGDV